jgi:hypothetical protein
VVGRRVEELTPIQGFVEPAHETKGECLKDRISSIPQLALLLLLFRCVVFRLTKIVGAFIFTSYANGEHN